MNEQIPKAVKVEMEANILKVQFDNGAVKYLKSHYNDVKYYYAGCVLEITEK